MGSLCESESEVHLEGLPTLPLSITIQAPNYVSRESPAGHNG